jgi:tetratricopeptide (TPR) repeat protein
MPAAARIAWFRGGRPPFSSAQMSLRNDGSTGKLRMRVADHDSKPVLLAGIPADFPEALRSQIKKEYGPALAHLDHAVSHFPSEAPRWRLVGNELRWKGTAIDLLKRRDETPRSAIARFPLLLRLQEAERELRSMTPDPSVAAQVQVDLGILALDFADRQAAIGHFTEAERAATEPFTRHVALVLRARTHDLSGRQDDAVSDYAAALRVIPHAWSASTALAALLFVRGDWDEARKLVTGAMTRAPAGRGSLDDPAQ